MIMRQAVMDIDLGIPPSKSGKVRDIYGFTDKLLLVSTDRISAFDWVLPTGIPDKGRVLNKLSEFWFETLDVPNHMISTSLADVPWPASVGRKLLEALEGRSMFVFETKVVPIECVVRGYLAGSGWKEYKKSGSVCGILLPGKLVESSWLIEPIFTPATKAETGHDENISFEQMCQITGKELAVRLRNLSLDIYRRGAAHALKKGVIIADTKFEFGVTRDGELLLIDEVLTPDSSRFWPEDQYKLGCGQPSFDKQFVRDWLEQSGWDRNSPPPPLPEEVVAKTREKYIEAYERLTGRPFTWK